jgi:addiction module HigA family antidote
MLREDFLPDFRLTASGLAESLGVSRQTVSELLRGRRAVSQEMALRLSRLFGNSPEFWLDAHGPLRCREGPPEGGPADQAAARRLIGCRGWA